MKKSLWDNNQKTVYVEPIISESITLKNCEDSIVKALRENLLLDRLVKEPCQETFDALIKNVDFAGNETELKFFRECIYLKAFFITSKMLWNTRLNLDDVENDLRYEFATSIIEDLHCTVEELKKRLSYYYNKGCDESSGDVTKAVQELLEGTGIDAKFLVYCAYKDDRFPKDFEEIFCNLI